MLGSIDYFTNWQTAIVYLILLSISFFDIKTKIIPDEFIDLILFIGLLNLTISATGSSQLNYLIVLDRIIGLTLGGLTLLTIAVMSDGGVGGGDIKLLASIGMLVGKIKILEIAIGVLLMASAIILIKGIFKTKSSTAFAPFIAIATVFCTVIL